MADKRILIVDDDADIRTALAELLQLEGYAVTEAVNGHAALNLLRSDMNFHLIILDYLMPVMSGSEFLEHRSADQEIQRIPTIVMTAMKKDLTHFHIHASLQKPLDIDVLLKSISSALSE
jgi:CheY-like chemotaxis protein